MCLLKLERVWCKVDLINNDQTENWELDFEVGITPAEMEESLEDFANFTFSTFEVRKVIGERSLKQNNPNSKLTLGNYTVKCICGGK